MGTPNPAQISMCVSRSLLAVFALWGTCPQSAHAEIPFADPAVIFTRADLDHNKQLDSAEQDALFIESNVDGWAIVQDAGGKVAALQAMDKSRDGVISSDEFLQATMPRFHRGVAEQD